MTSTTSTSSRAADVHATWEAAGYRRLRPAITFRTGPVQWIAPNGDLTTNPASHMGAVAHFRVAQEGPVQRVVPMHGE